MVRGLENSLEWCFGLENGLERCFGLENGLEWCFGLEISLKHCYGPENSLKGLHQLLKSLTADECLNCQNTLFLYISLLQHSSSRHFSLFNCPT